MKNFKKVLALVLALSVMFALAVVPATADDPAETTSSSVAANTIKINNAIKGVTYTVYKIFDVTYDSTTKSYAYTILSNSEWYDAVNSYSGGGLTLTANGEYVAGEDKETQFYVTFDEDKYSASGFAAYLTGKTSGVKKVISGEITDDTTTDLSFNTGGTGYFLVTSSYGSNSVLVTTTSVNGAEMDEKNTLPSISKNMTTSTSLPDTAAETTSNSTSLKVGDTVTYQVLVNVDKTSDSDFIVHDSMSDGLTLNNNSFKYYVGTKNNDDTWSYSEIDSTNKNYANFQLNTNPNESKTCDVYDGSDTDKSACSFEVTIKQTYIASLAEQGTPIYIVYTATVNKNAINDSSSSESGSTQTNKATLQVSDNTEKTTDENPTKVMTYGFELVKFTNSDGSATNGTVLDGAKFKLYSDKECETEIELVETSSNSGVYRPKTSNDNDEATTIVAGDVKIVGLATGTYYLKETEAPSGYNILTAAQTVTVGNSDNWATVSNGTYSSGGVGILNQTGTEIPTTGGIGTTIFYVLGGLLIVGAGVLLITRKRMTGSAR